MSELKVLLGLPDKSSGKSIADSLKKEGFSVLFAEDGKKAIELAQKMQPDVAILDMNIPELGGLEVCHLLRDGRDTENMGVLLISPNGTADDRVKGFELGADDVISKPYEIRELISRIKAVSRRVNYSQSTIRVRDLEIDLIGQKVLKAGKPLHLTFIEYRLLCFLVLNRRRIVSRKEIVEKIWGDKSPTSERTVDVHIKRLREKLGEVKYPSEYIKTLHKRGYQFV